jgi:phosphoribosyl 1,2-cyclic phosphodiesterase
LKPKIQYKIGGFVVMALPVQHNCENYSFLITHKEFGSLVFCTDAVSFPYKIKGLNHLLIEANNSEDLMIDNLCRNQEIRSHNEYHMEINQTIEAIKRNMNPELRTLMLVHLSDGQSDEKLFQKMVFEEVGIRPIIADKNVKVELNSEDF